VDRSADRDLAAQGFSEDEVRTIRRDYGRALAERLT